MKKIGFLADAHANLPALKVALSKMQDENCDEIIIGGDSIGIGPFPVECLDLIINTPRTRFINGNHELCAIFDMSEEFRAELGEGEVAHTEWYRSLLGQEHIEFLNKCPLLIEEKYEGVSVKFMHYALKVDGPKIFPYEVHVGGDKEKQKVFSKYSTDLICFGHDHLATLIQGPTVLINPGSLGCFPKSIARFVIIEFENEQFEIKKYALEYDDSSLLPAFETREVPDRQFLLKVFFGGRLK